MAQLAIRNLLGIVVLAMSSLLAPGPGSAQLSPIGAPLDDTAARAALVRFNGLAEASKPAGQMPRVTDPAVRQALAAIWDVRLLDPARRAGAADIQVLMRFCEAGGQVWRSYFQFNPGGAANPDLAANMKTYADEIMPGFAFSVRCSATTLEAAVAFLAALPAEQMNQVRRDGWNRMRLGATQVIRGTLTTLGDASVAPDHAAMIAKALADSAPRFAAGLEPSERQAVAEAARSALPNMRLAPIRAAVETFVATLNGR